MKHFYIITRLICLGLALIILTSSYALAQTSKLAAEFYPADSIYPGLRGYAKICFNGSEIHEIPVEVISLVGQRSPEKPYNFFGFIARVSGPVIDITHGIGDGASGAPVYFHNKLAGSIVGLVDYDFGAHDLISCRNIAESLKLFDYPSFNPQATVEKNDQQNNSAENKPLALYPAIKINNQTYTSICFNNKIRNQQTLSIRYCTKIIRLPNESKDYDPFIPWWQRHKNLALAPTYSTQLLPLDKQRDPLTLQPGAPVAIVLVRGDVNWVVIGTMTYIAPDGKFIAFGHDNFDRAGSINVPCALAYYLTTITSMNRFITLAQSKEIIGTVLEDRREGMAGTLGNWSGSWVPVSMHTKQINEQRNVKLLFEIPNSSEIVWDVLRSVVNFGAVRTIDTFGDINLETNVKLIINTNPQREISYRNCYTINALSQMLNQFNYITSKLELNDREELYPKEVNIELETLQGSDRARIFNVELLDKNNQPLKPKDNGQFTVTKGEDLLVKVYLQYYNGKISEAVHTIKWPNDNNKLNNNNLVLQIFGGGGLTPLWSDNAPQIIQEADSNRNRFIDIKEIPAPETTDDLINNLLPTYQNDNLVIQLVNNNNDLRDTTGTLPNFTTVLVPQPRHTIIGFKRFDLEVLNPAVADKK